MSMQSALRTRLLADATISGLVSTRIYDGQAPQGAAFPRILIQQISGGSDYHLTGETRVADAIFQIGCWSKTTAEASAIADAIRLEISGKRGTYGSGGDIATVESCQRTGSFITHEDPVDGSAIRAAIGSIEEYTIKYIITPA